MPDAQPMTEAMYYVLLALRTPAHGYGLLGRIREISGGRLEMGPGTLYGILTRLKKEGLILFLCEIIFAVANMILSAIFAFLGPLVLLWTLVAALVNIAFLVLLILGIVNAAQGMAKELPLIGKFRILK